jgi:hypothetical protein
MCRHAGLGLLLLAGCSTFVRDKPVEIPGAVKRVVVQVDHGNVEIIASAETTTVEIVRTSKDSAGPGSQHAMKDGVLTITGSCGGTPKCRINHRVRVPLETAVTITVKDGDVALMDVGGDVSVDVGLGNVSGLRLASNVADVHTEGGNIDLIFLTGPQRLTAQVAAGDIDLRVPAGDYRCEIDEKAVPPFGVKCDTTATRVITATTAVGRISLRATD